MSGGDGKVQQKVFGMFVCAWVNEKLHKKCVNELNNVHLSGSD